MTESLESLDWMKLFDRVQELQITGQRKGQAFYNAAYEQNEQVREVVNTERDPFHNDGKLDLFLAWLMCNFTMEGADADGNEDEDEGLHDL